MSKKPSFKGGKPKPDLGFGRDDAQPVRFTDIDGRVGKKPKPKQPKDAHESSK